MSDYIKKLAEQAGMEWETQSWCWLANPPHLEKFAELVRQNERKSCANILESFAEDMENREWSMGAAAMRGAADTIRFKQSSDEAEGEK